MNCHENSVLAAALRIVWGVASPRDLERLAALQPVQERAQVMVMAQALETEHKQTAQSYGDQAAGA